MRPPGRSARIAAWVVSGLLMAFLAFDIAIHLLRHPAAVQAAQDAGYDPALLPVIGAVELVCAALYAIPRTARLGAVLMTGYLGGAGATNLVTGTGWFSVVFAPLLGVALWACLAARDPWVLQMLQAPAKTTPGAATATAA